MPIIASKGMYSKDHVEIHMVLASERFLELPQLCYGVFTLNETPENHNHRNYYKEMNEASKRIGSREPEHPEN